MRGEMVAEQMRHECALPRPTVEVCLKLTFRTVATTDFTRGMVNERICRSAEIRVHHLEYCSAIFGILLANFTPRLSQVWRKSRRRRPAVRTEGWLAKSRPREPAFGPRSLLPSAGWSGRGDSNARP